MFSMARLFSIFATIGTALPRSARNSLTCLTSAAFRTNDCATISTPWRIPNSRSSWSLSVNAGTSSEWSGTLTPFLELSSPPAATSVTTSVSVVAVTLSSIDPSLRSIASPGLTIRANPGNSTVTVSGSPVTVRVVSVNLSPALRISGSGSTIPTRIFWPARSCIMATGFPSSAETRRIARIRSPCSSWVPCEKLSLATFMPD